MGFNRSALSALPLSALNPSSTYYYRFFATNSYGSAWGNPAAQFVTFPNTPLITNGAATGVTDTNAMLNGNLTWVGSAATTVIVYYGTVDRGATGWEGSQNLGRTRRRSSATIAGGLTFYTKYYYRFYATNSYGGAWACPRETFTTRWGANWRGGKAKITFSGYNRTETLTNFPALVVLPTNGTITNFLYSQMMRADGYELRFADSDETTDLNYEIDTWNTNGNSYVWVQVPTFTNNCSIWAYWGNPAVTNQQAYTTNGATWGTNYPGVWHLGSARGATASDTLPNARDGTLRNMEDTDWIAGVVGNGLVLQSDGSNEYIDGLGTVPQGGQTYTVSCWFYQTNTPSGYAEILSQWTSANSGNSFFFGFNNSDIRFSDSWNDVNIGSYANNTWHHLVGVSTPNNAQMDLHGQLKVMKASALLYTGWGPLLIGKQGELNAEYYAGRLDEVREETTGRSSNWVWACYMNMASNSVFNTYSAATNQAGATTYTLTVTSGTGSGSYTAGIVVNITANAAPAGQVFDAWVVNSGNPAIADTNAASTTLTMPASAVAVTATYKAVTRLLISVVENGGNLSLQVDTVLGATYVLESAPSLSLPMVWTPLATNIGNGGPLTNTLPQEPGTPQRFFRYQVR